MQIICTDQLQLPGKCWSWWSGHSFAPVCEVHMSAHEAHCTCTEHSWQDKNHSADTNWTCKVCEDTMASLSLRAHKEAPNTPFHQTLAHAQLIPCQFKENTHDYTNCTTTSIVAHQNRGTQCGSKHLPDSNFALCASVEILASQHSSQEKHV